MISRKPQGYLERAVKAEAEVERLTRAHNDLLEVSSKEVANLEAKVDRLLALTRKLYLSTLAGWAREDLMYLSVEERNARIDAALGHCHD